MAYTLSSNDQYSIGVVSYGSDNSPRTGNVVEGIKASDLSLVRVLSTDQGSWRALTSAISSDGTAASSSYTFSLYDLGKTQTAPLATSQTFKGYSAYPSASTSSAFYVVSRDSSSSYNDSSTDIFKLSRDTLATSAKATVKGYPNWEYLYDRGVIYSSSYSSLSSYTFLDADLKTTLNLSDGKYSYGSLMELDDSSFALPFVSSDFQVITGTEGYSYTRTVTKDLGILKLSGSTSTVIVSSADVGLTADTEYGAISNMVKDGSGGLYFSVRQSTGSAAYRWDGSKTTSLYSEDGASANVKAVDGSGNVYFQVSKSETTSDETSYTTTETMTLYRTSTSATSPTKLLEVTTTSSNTLNSYAEIHYLTQDDSGNLYFEVEKGTHGSGSAASTSRATAFSF